MFSAHLIGPRVAVVLLLLFPGHKLHPPPVAATEGEEALCIRGKRQKGFVRVSC